MKKRSRLILGLTALGVAAFVVTFHPSRPLYMRRVPVNVVSPDGTILAGTLSLPRWAREPVPAVVAVHGSGPLTRDDLVGDVRRLVKEGIGVLAYDKRGCGASGGAYPRGAEVGFERVLTILAQDAEAAFARLREEAGAGTGVDPARLGFFGASQAGWIVPLAALRLDPQPRFHILLSAPAVSTGIEGYYSQLTGDGRRAPEIADPLVVRSRVADYTGPAGFDPAPAWMELRIPTLWLLGDRDESVPTFATVRVLESIREAGNEAHTVVVYPELDHALRDVRTRKSAPLWRDIRSWLERERVLDARGG